MNTSTLVRAVALCASLAMATISNAQTVRIFVDGAHGDPNQTVGTGGWGTAAFRHIPAAVARAWELIDPAGEPDFTSAHIWVRSIDSSDDPIIYLPINEDYGSIEACSGDKQAAVELHPNIFLYGGFSGTEVSGSDFLTRRPVERPAIVSGDLCADDDPYEEPQYSWPSSGDGIGDNSANVFRTATDGSVTDLRFIDGFTIRNGWAHHDAGIYTGGGMAVRDARVAVARTTFVYNYAVGGGGNVVISSSLGNPEAATVVDFVNCTIAYGSVVKGESTQHDTGVAGGVFIFGSRSKVLFLNCLVHDNHADHRAGGIFHGGDPQLVGELRIFNTTVADNIVYRSPEEVGQGGTPAGSAGITVIGSVEVDIVNNILHGNVVHYDPLYPNNPVALSICQQQLDVDPTTSTVTFTLIESDDGSPCISGPGNIGGDPLFVNGAGDNYRLLHGSPARMAGDVDLVETDTAWKDHYNLWQSAVADPADEVAPDRAGDARITACKVDMGGYQHLPFGDLNEDGVVDFEDLLMVLSSFGPCAAPNDCAADLNEDGTVDFDDLLLILSNWSDACDEGDVEMGSILECINRLGLSDPVALAACIEAMFLLGTP